MQLDVGIAISDQYDALDVANEFEKFIGEQCHSSGFGFGFRDMQFDITGDVNNLMNRVNRFFEENNIPVNTGNDADSYFSIN